MVKPIPAAALPDPFSGGVALNGTVHCHIGPIDVEVHPAAEGRPPRFILYRSLSPGSRVMFASGCDDTMGACMDRAVRAAKLAAQHP